MYSLALVSWLAVQVIRLHSTPVIHGDRGEPISPSYLLTSIPIPWQECTHQTLTYTEIKHLNQ